MKTSNLVKLSLVLIVVAFASSVTGYICGVRADNKLPEETTKKETAVKITSRAEKTVDKVVEKAVVTQFYLLKETDGYIALHQIYSDGSEKLYRSYDISVNHLPQSDREALKEGIRVESLSEALQLIEDYS